MEIKMIPIEEIIPNPQQPRETFEREKLKELAETIKKFGILQPILVRPKGEHYELIAGERRLKACQIAGKSVIPALVKDIPDEEVMIQSLIENAHREDLKSIEKAKAILEVFKTEQDTASFSLIDDRLPQKVRTTYEKIGSTKALSDEEEKIKGIGEKIGLNLLTIYHYLRILKLPDSIQEKSKEKEIKARTLAKISSLKDEETQEKVFEKIVEEGLSSTEVSKLTKAVKEADKKKSWAVKEALLKPRSKIKPEIAEEILEVPEEDQKVLIKELEKAGEEFEEIVHQRVEKAKHKTMAKIPKPIKLEITLQEQYQHQRVWNLKQLVGKDLVDRTEKFYFDFITIGYSQKNFKDFVESLKAAGVTLLIDVRKNPVSQYKLEFNKDFLETELREENIQYEHIRELGVPRILRNEVFEGKITTEEFFERYDKEILTEKALEILIRVSEGHRTFAIMCTEVDPTMCHRHRIARALNQIGKVGYDL